MDSRVRIMDDSEQLALQRDCDKAGELVVADSGLAEGVDRGHWNSFSPQLGRKESSQSSSDRMSSHYQRGVRIPFQQVKYIVSHVVLYSVVQLAVDVVYLAAGADTAVYKLKVIEDKGPCIGRAVKGHEHCVKLCLKPSVGAHVEQGVGSGVRVGDGEVPALGAVPEADVVFRLVGDGRVADQPFGQALVVSQD